MADVRPDSSLTVLAVFFLQKKRTGAYEPGAIVEMVLNIESGKLSLQRLDLCIFFGLDSFYLSANNPWIFSADKIFLPFTEAIFCGYHFLFT